MANHIKGIVSKKKKRYKEDGFDLDLAYIRENVIAMGFPASKLEGMFRNHIDDVVKFMEQKHAGHYKIYNLCSERDYDGTKFNCEIGNYPFEDHNPPNLGIIRPFCEDMADWLGRDERNVAAVHCKAGKGRTGVMICCYMLHTGLFSTAEKALDYYGKQRTHDKKGVTIPSQRRYVEYYSMLLRSKLQYKPVTCLLRAVELVPLPSISNLNSAQLTLYQLNQDIDGGDKTNNPSVTEVAVVKGSVEGNALRFNVGNPLPLRGDIKVEVTHVNKLMQKEKLLHCWVNTFFVTMCPFNSVPSMYIPQHSVDDSMLLCPQDTRSRHQRVRHQSGSTQRPVSGMPSPGVPSAPLLTTPPAQPQPVDSPSPGGPWRMGGPNNSGGSSSSADSGKENYIPLTKASSVSGFPAPPEGGTVAVKSRRSEPRVTTTRTVTLTKKEIDKAAKDKAQRFDKDFKVLLHFLNESISAPMHVFPGGNASSRISRTRSGPSTTTALSTRPTLSSSSDSSSEESWDSGEEDSSPSSPPHPHPCPSIQEHPSSGPRSCVSRTRSSPVHVHTSSFLPPGQTNLHDNHFVRRSFRSLALGRRWRRSLPDLQHKGANPLQHHHHHHHLLAVPGTRHRTRSGGDHPPHPDSAGAPAVQRNGRRTSITSFFSKTMHSHQLQWHFWR